MPGLKYRDRKSAAAFAAVAMACALAGCHGASDCEEYREAILRLVPRDAEPARPVVYMCGDEVTTYAGDARTSGRAAAVSACDATGCPFASVSRGRFAHQLCVGFVSARRPGALFSGSTAGCDPVWLFGGDVWIPIASIHATACGVGLPGTPP